MDEGHANGTAWESQGFDIVQGVVSRQVEMTED